MFCIASHDVTFCIASILAVKLRVASPGTNLRIVSRGAGNAEDSAADKATGNTAKSTGSTAQFAGSTVN